MPRKPQTAPIPADSISIRGKLSVSIRAETGGMTVAPADEQNTQHLERDHDGSRQHQGEHRLHPSRGNAVELGHVAVEGGEKEVFVGHEKHQRNHSGHHAQGHQVSRG